MAKKTSRAQIRIANRSQAAMMLRSQGYTIRQICEMLRKGHNNGKPIDPKTIFTDIERSIKRINNDTDETTRHYKTLLLQQCDEDFGRFADMLAECDTREGIDYETRTKLRLQILDRRIKVRENVMDIVGLRKSETVNTSAGEILGVVSKGLGIAIAITPK